LRLVIVLLLPATVGLWVMAEPIIRLLFEHGSFTPADTVMTAKALRFYLIGLPFAGIDFLLNYAYYARQNTRTPAAVGVISVGLYFVVALLLKEPFGFLGLVLADSAKQAGHALIMSTLLVRSLGRFRGQGIEQTTLKVIGAVLLDGLLIAALTPFLTANLPHGLLGEVLVVAIAGGVGAAAYLGMLRLLHVTEMDTLVTRLLRRSGQ
jgi:putative peptidoglycan lipid II flippase